jgi:hypothetical protein
VRRRGRRLGRSAHTSRVAGDDHDQWMETFEALDDDQVDALLAGRAPVDGILVPVARVVQALRHLAASEPVPPMSASLRAQIASPIVTPIGIRRAARSAFVKAAAVAALLALVGVGAAQNRLPSGIQDVVSSTADLVGVDVPRSEERHADGEGLGTGDPQGDADSTPAGDARGNDGSPGHDGVTPGGAVPADPGTPADHEPATPAVPPTSSSGGGAGNEAKPPKDLTPSSTIPSGQGSSNPNAVVSGPSSTNKAS